MSGIILSTLFIFTVSYEIGVNLMPILYTKTLRQGKTQGQVSSNGESALRSCVSNRLAMPLVMFSGISSHHTWYIKGDLEIFVEISICMLASAADILKYQFAS